VRRTPLVLLLLAAVVVVAVAVVASRRPPVVGGPPGRGDPAFAARRAGEGAGVVALLVTLVAPDGVEVARARLDGDRAEVAAGGLGGVQQAGRLTSGGATVEVPPVDRVRLLAPLAERPARWEGGHLRLEGSPPARAWLDGRGQLARLEVDLGAGRLLVVSPVG